MVYQRYIPEGLISRFVDQIVYINGPAAGVALPRMYQTIIFNLGPNFFVSSLTEKDCDALENKARIWINGKQDQPLMIQHSGEAKMYVAGVKQGMLPWLTGMPAVQTNGRAVSSELWAGQEISELYEALQNVRSTEDGFVMISDYFMKVVSQKSLEHLERIDWLQNAVHALSVAEICAHLKISRKKLLNDAQFYLGDSVKKIQGLTRFNKMLASIAKEPGKSLSSLHDFYDQSHFIHDFRMYAGLTPSAFRRLCTEYPYIRNNPNFIAIERETFLQFTAG